MAKRYNYFDDEYESTLERSRKKLQSKVDSTVAMLERDVNDEKVEIDLDMFSASRNDRPKREPKPEKSSKTKSKKTAKANKPAVDTAKAMNDAKEVIGNAIVLAKLGSKKAERMVKSVAKQAKRSRIALKHRVILSVLIVLVLIGAMVITVFSTLNYVNKETEREQLFNEAAGKICTEYEESYGACNYESLEEQDVKGYRMTGLCYVREIDFNDDKESELFLAYNKGGEYFAEVWGFDGGNFVNLYKGSFVQSDDIKDDVWFTIYNNNGKNYICEHSSEDTKNATILALRGNKFTKKTVCTYNAESEVYSIRGKEEPDAFERIRVSVLMNHGAIKLADAVSDKVYEFTGKEKSAGVGSKQGMLNAYYSIIENYNDLYGVAENVSKDGVAYINGVAYADLIDFNNDDIDELLILFRKPVGVRQKNDQNIYIAVTEDRYFCEVYSWNGQNAFRVFQTEGLSESLGSDSDQYIIIQNGEKKKQLCFNHFTSEEYGRVTEATSKILRFNGEQFVNSFRAWNRNDYGYQEYRIDGEWLSRSEFESQRGYQVPFFDGSQKYDEDKYTVIYVQTDKSHSSRLNNITSKTVDNIRKLNKNYQPK